MTAEEASRIQVWAAMAQTLLALVIGVATIYFARAANHLAKLQAAASIEPDVTLDLYALPWTPEPGEPLNHIRIKNHSPLELDSLTLKAELFGQGADLPKEGAPS